MQAQTPRCTPYGEWFGKRTRQSDVRVALNGKSKRPSRSAGPELLSHREERGMVGWLTLPHLLLPPALTCPPGETHTQQMWSRHFHI